MCNEMDLSTESDEVVDSNGSVEKKEGTIQNRVLLANTRF